MKFIIKFYNFIESKWLEDLKSSSNFTKFGDIARGLLQKSLPGCRHIKCHTSKFISKNIETSIKM